LEGGISMPFYPVRDKYVFLHHKNYIKLNEIALKDKSSSWRFSSHIAGRKESKEAEKLRYRTLSLIYKQNAFEEFYNNWIYFNLQSEEEILQNILFLLSDYGWINNNFSYKKINQYTSDILFPDKHSYYEISIYNKGLFKKPKLVFSTRINTIDIISIKGELNNFTIDLGNKNLIFGKIITLIDKNTPHDNNQCDMINT
jgi:hypothetical protein